MRGRIENHMRRLVGRRTQARPAKRRDMRRLSQGLLVLLCERGRATYLFIDFVVSKTPCLLESLEDDDFAKGLEGVSPDISHGQKYSAIIVKVVSRLFDNVLVEQNHCHGLKIVIRSYHTRVSLEVVTGI